MMRYGANINAQNGAGNSVLHQDIKRDMHQRIQSFIDLGADINMKNFDGNTPLTQLSLSISHSWIINILLNYGADPCIKNNKGISMATRCLKNKSNSELTKLIQARYENQKLLELVTDPEPSNTAIDEFITI